jgi:hypothetical protein
VKLRQARTLKRGDRVSIDGYWLEIARVTVVEGEIVLSFLNGKVRVTDPDEILAIDDMNGES